MFQFIDIPTFLVSLALGIVYIACITPKPEVVRRFPNPYNLETIYKSETSDSCFKYEAEATECPIDQTLIKQQPVDP